MTLLSLAIFFLISFPLIYYTSMSDIHNINMSQRVYTLFAIMYTMTFFFAISHLLSIIVYGRG